MEAADVGPVETEINEPAPSQAEPGQSEPFESDTEEPAVEPVENAETEFEPVPPPAEPPQARREPAPPPPPPPREYRPASPNAIQQAIDEVNHIIVSLRETLDDMEEVLEFLELAERQKNADEHEIEALRRSLRQFQQRPRDGGHPHRGR